MNNKIYTAIDANINRAMEGLRVCEDILRFVLLSQYSREIKELRHKIKKSSEVFPRESLLRARDVGGDSQKFYDLDDELSRSSIADIFNANLHRAIEAVRALEEFTKTTDCSASKDLQEVRFLLYDIEKKVHLNLIKSEGLNKFNNSLYAILDSSFVENDDYSGYAKKMIKGGASIIQLRMKGEASRNILHAAKEVAHLCREANRIFIVNDHPGIASLSGAQGLHLGQDDIPVQEARKILPSDAIIGVSTHSYEQAMEAAEEKPDYIAIGPLYTTKSKTGKETQGKGVEVVSRIKEAVEIPIVGIGGITLSRINELKGAGCGCFCMISELYKDGKIEKNCRDLVKAME